jgi:hypothetical protein
VSDDNDGAAARTETAPAKRTKRETIFALLVAAKTPIRWMGVIFSGAAVVFAVLSYFGFWSSLRGDDLIGALAERLDTSYDAEVKRQVRPGDLEWDPLLRVIRRYTRADLPTDREPRVLARSQAILSAKTEQAEWTAPTTPILLLYADWPQPPGQEGHPLTIGREAFIIGTLGDLHEWIKRDQSDFDFLWRNIIFGALSFCVGVFLALPYRSSSKMGPRPPDSERA